MSCTYFYKGHRIGDVRQLDDFLIEKKPYESIFGDMVFLNKERLLYSKSKLKDVEDLAKDLLARYNEARRAAKHCFDGEAVLKMKRPYVGVSEFLSGMRDENGKLYFPEFVEAEYWSRRYNAWASGNPDELTEDELQLFFDGDKSKVTKIDLGNPNDWRLPDGSFKNDFGTDEQKRLRDLITDKWTHQASMGTQLHNVLQHFFSPNKSGNHWFDVLNDASTRPMHTTTFIKELRNSKVITSDISDDHVKQVLDYAFQLKQDLEDRFGTNLTYYPEFTLHADLNKEYEGRDDLKILGRADLLILDENGTPHIVDYKTSPKMYENYGVPKKLGFVYQQATYERMLRRAKLPTEDTDIIIAPIQMENFRKEGGKWIFDKVVKGTNEGNSLKSLLGDIGNIPRVPKNLDEFLEAPMILDGNSEDIISKVTEDMAVLFPRYGNSKTKTYEQVLDLIKEQLGEDPNGWVDKTTGMYTFKPKGSTYEITLDNEGPGSETKFIQKIVKHYNSAKENNLTATRALIKSFNEILRSTEKTEEDMNWPEGTSEWARKTLSKYLTGHWTILDGDAQRAAQNFGMILFHNPITNVVEVVKVSLGTNLKWLNSWGPDGTSNNSNYTNIIAGCNNGINDSVENSRSDSLMLKATNGNIEMMEAMLVLDNIDFGTDIQLGGIRVINPHQTKTSQGAGLVARNAEMLYSWNKLQPYRVNKTNKFGKDGSIHLLSDVEVCYQEFNNILDLVGNSGHGGRFEKLRPSLNKLQDALIPGSYDKELALDALMELRKILEEKFGMKIDQDVNGQGIHKGVLNYSQQYERTLYQKVNQAILDLNNIQVRQMLKSHGDFYDGNPKNIFSEGWSGYYVDNANNFKNLLINQITNIVLEGYQNARDRGSREMRELRNDVEKLKKSSGYSGFVEHTIGNQTSLYENMTEFTADGDLRFVNPWKHPERIGSQAKVDFLKKYIVKINKNINPNLTDAEIDAKIKQEDKEFFQVPLIEGSFASKVNTDGWLGWIKNKFKMLKNWSTFKEYLRDKQSEFFSEDIERESKNDAIIFEATNLMDKGIDQHTRLEIIKKMRAKRGDGFFERDLERIVGTHTWAYITHDALEDRMPLLKAAYISLAVAGNDLNYDFKNEMTYFKDFVTNKIKKESIVDERFKEAKGAVSGLQKATSWMALALSPVQMTYQSLEGIWKDAKLIITKPDGSEAFTFKNMKKAAGIVYKDLGHTSDDPTVTSGINALYGINDMDARSFVDNNSSNNHGLFNFFGKFAMKFSSRPDYYNRMTIFTAQMLKDGSRDAHSINKDGQLVYNWKKDDRFKAYANNDKSNMEEYQKAKALYYATAQQLIREGARNVDGSIFQMGDPLPKAYSNKESEAMKAVGDTMYGYYDSTKKSLMQSQFLGSLFMQMRTFWSGKKNQYLGPGGFKAQGKWAQMKDPDGNDLYYSKGADGEIDPNAPLVTKDDPNCSGTAFMQWKGKFEEGVLLTLWDVLKRAYQHKSIKGIFDNSFINERAEGDEELRKTLISNMRLLITDLVMLALIGSLAAAMTDWADEVAKDAKKSQRAEDALYATFAGLAARTVKNSSLDFAWWKSLFEPSMDWNPFAISYLGNEAKAITNFITGDATAALTLVKSFSAARQIRPIFVYLDLQ